MAYPISTYAPWQADRGFQRVYEQVKRNTLVDVWRCYELWACSASWSRSRARFSRSACGVAAAGR